MRAEGVAVGVWGRRGWGGSFPSSYDTLPKLKSNQSERPEGGPGVLSQSFRSCQSHSG